MSALADFEQPSHAHLNQPPAILPGQHACPAFTLSRKPEEILLFRVPAGQHCDSLTARGFHFRLLVFRRRTLFRRHGCSFTLLQQSLDMTITFDRNMVFDAEEGRNILRIRAQPILCPCFKISPLWHRTMEPVAFVCFRCSCPAFRRRSPQRPF